MEDNYDHGDLNVRARYKKLSQDTYASSDYFAKQTERLQKMCESLFHHSNQDRTESKRPQNLEMKFHDFYKDFNEHLSKLMQENQQLRDLLRDMMVDGTKRRTSKMTSEMEAADRETIHRASASEAHYGSFAQYAHVTDTFATMGSYCDKCGKGGGVISKLERIEQYEEQLEKMRYAHDCKIEQLKKDYQKLRKDQEKLLKDKKVSSSKEKFRNRPKTIFSFFWNFWHF